MTSYGYNAANQLCWTYNGTSSSACAAPPTGASTYAFNANGDQTATSSGFAATYNSLGQTSTWKPAGGSTTTTFNYADADSTERTRNGTNNWASGPLGLAYYDQGTSNSSWVRDPAGHLIAQYRSATASYSYYLTDAQGSVVGLVGAAGTITDRYRYDAYGNATYTSGTTPNPWRYTSGYQDDPTSLKLGTRYYNPTLGRFTQTDPVKTQPPYTYTSDDPINRADPSGRNPACTALSVLSIVPTDTSAGGLALYVLEQYFSSLALETSPYQSALHPRSSILANVSESLLQHQRQRTPMGPTPLADRVNIQILRGYRLTRATATVDGSRLGRHRVATFGGLLDTGSSCHSGVSL